MRVACPAKLSNVWRWVQNHESCYCLGPVGSFDHSHVTCSVIRPILCCSIQKKFCVWNFVNTFSRVFFRTDIGLSFPTVRLNGASPFT